MVLLAAIETDGVAAQDTAGAVAPMGHLRAADRRARRRRHRPAGRPVGSHPRQRRHRLVGPGTTSCRCRAASRCFGWRRAQWPRPCMRSQGRPTSGCGALRCNRSRFKRCMCGIAGFADSSSLQRRTPEADFTLVHPMCDVIRHRGPDDEGVHVEPGVGARHAAAEHHRPRDRPSADSQRGSDGLGRLQRRDLQLPRAAAASSRPPATGSTRPATPSDRPRLRGVGRGGVRAAARHVRHRDLGSPRRARCCSRATASGIKPLHYADGAAAGCTSGPRSSRCSRPAPSIRATSTSEALDHYLSFLYTPRDRVDLQGRPQAAARALPDAGATAASTSGSTGSSATRRPFRGTSEDAAQALASGAGRRRRARTWSATCRSARFSPAASTRASSSG